MDWRRAPSRATNGALPDFPPESRSSSRLIADGDSAARHAFRVGLQTDTPLPTAPRANAGATQELDPNDILEVQDIAEAIARAEKLVAAPRSSRPAGVAPIATIASIGRPAVTEAEAERIAGPSLADMFDALGHPPHPRRLTDDTIGAATPAPPPGIPTPVPPRYLAMPSAAPISKSSTRSFTSITSSDEDDAYYQPAGRIRSLADMTLDGYRPEPTLLVRAAGRRKRFSWIFLAILLPLVVLAAIAIFASADAPSSYSSPASVAGAKVAASVHASTKSTLETTSATSKSVASATVFDVNSLPSASPRP
jgi:hypothetical protein